MLNDSRLVLNSNQKHSCQFTQSHEDSSTDLESAFRFAFSCLRSLFASLIFWSSILRSISRALAEAISASLKSSALSRVRCFDVLKIRGQRLGQQQKIEKQHFIMGEHAQPRMNAHRMHATMTPSNFGALCSICRSDGSKFVFIATQRFNLQK